MSLSDAGSEITIQEAADLLHKLATESVKVLAHLTLRPGSQSSATVTGRVKLGKDGSVCIMNCDELLSSKLTFNPSFAIRRIYGDDRSLDPYFNELLLGGPRFLSALCFFFPDSSLLGLWECANLE
jgi:hypothetical protein